MSHELLFFELQTRTIIAMEQYSKSYTALDKREKQSVREYINDMSNTELLMLIAKTQVTP